MKRIIALGFTFLFFIGACYADSIVNYKVNYIQHPDLNEKNKPLIISYQIQWNGGNIEQFKIVCNPMFINYYYSRDGKEYIEPKTSEIVYYDAYLRPDKKGFVMFKRTKGYNSKGLEGIEIWDLSENQSYKLEPYGSEIFFSKDMKYLITIGYKMSSDVDIDSYILYYYDLSNLMGGYNKPLKKNEIEPTEFNNLQLIHLQ